MNKKATYGRREVAAGLQTLLAGLTRTSTRPWNLCLYCALLSLKTFRFETRLNSWHCCRPLVKTLSKRHVTKHAMLPAHGPVMALPAKMAHFFESKALVYRSESCLVALL
jgi:hypothetical protein